MYESKIKSELKRKYRIRHLLSFSESASETLWTLATFLLCTAAVAYFSSHFMLWLTGHYDTVQAIMIAH